MLNHICDFPSINKYNIVSMRIPAFYTCSEKFRQQTISFRSNEQIGSKKWIKISSFALWNKLARQVLSKATHRQCRVPATGSREESCSGNIDVLTAIRPVTVVHSGSGVALRAHIESRALVYDARYTDLAHRWLSRAPTAGIVPILKVTDFIVCHSGNSIIAEQIGLPFNERSRV